MTAHKAFDDSDVQALPAVPRTKSSEDVRAEHPLLEARHVDSLAHSVQAMTTVLVRAEKLHRDQLDVLRSIARSTEAVREKLDELRAAIIGDTDPGVESETT